MSVSKHIKEHAMLGTYSGKEFQDHCRRNVFTAVTPSTADVNAIQNFGSTILAVGTGGFIWRARGIPSAFAAATSGTVNDLYDMSFGLTFPPFLLHAVVVGASGTVIESQNTFTTWNAVTTTRTADLTTIDGDGDGTWLTGGAVDTGNQVWKITYSGGTFTMVALTTPAGMDGVDVTRVKWISGTTYIVATSGAGIWRTTDNGANWTQVWVDGITKVFSFGIGADRILAGGSNSLESAAFWLESTDDGVTWTSVTPTGADVLGKIWYNNISIYNGTWLVGTGEDHGLYSLDDGETFEEISATGYFGIGDAPVVDYTATWLIPADTSGTTKNVSYVYGSTGGIINYSLMP